SAGKLTVNQGNLRAAADLNPPRGVRLDRSLDSIDIDVIARRQASGPGTREGKLNLSAIVDRIGDSARDFGCDVVTTGREISGLVSKWTVTGSLMSTMGRRPSTECRIKRSLNCVRVVSNSIADSAIVLDILDLA